MPMRLIASLLLTLLTLFSLPSSAISEPTVKETADASFFPDVVEASKTHPVVVLATSESCPSCKKLLAQLKPIAETAGASIVTVDIDKNLRTAENLMAKQLPLVVVFKNSTLIGRATAGNLEEVKRLLAQ